ncbi:MAG: response regulator transcription factor [Nitrosomonas sp.]|uniref:response regulator transcription factor n=1 Tax=Nitrosomonas sp. TaxID=42353 RepID=UPI0025CD5A98|nr:response regulator transcription factor [Nitrosomonas sp.]MCG7757112.1 response regulator transcription factor [Nitrosomonas sp.]UJP03556.1 MAG: response regulator transcription factor [Nitrosomonas sp.]
MSIETSINTINFLLVEDDWRLRDSLLHGLAGNPKLRCIATADSGQQALAHLRTHKIDLVIMDYALNDHGFWGVELTRDIHKRFPETKILFWSAHIREVDLEQAKEAGANGYVSKDKSDQDVIDAIHKIMRGEQVWEADEFKVTDVHVINKRLTPMEVKIMELLAEGKQNTQIAYNLLEIEYRKITEDFGGEYVKTRYGDLQDFIDEEKLRSRTRTVERHFDNIREKLSIRNRSDLFRLALNEYGKLEIRRMTTEIEIKVLMLVHEEKEDAEIAELLGINIKNVQSIKNKFQAEK